MAGSGPARDDRARGLMLGLLVGDAAAEIERDPEGRGPVRGTALSQLACYTVEGLIRALMRDEHTESILDPLGCVWRAYGRWAIGQGLPIGRSLANEVRTTGWLHEVATLSAIRGRAPALTAALASGRGSIVSPAGASGGHHALNRSLPLAMVTSYAGYHEEGARELAALSHGAPTAWDAAAAGVLVLAEAMHASTIGEACLGALAAARRREVTSLICAEDSRSPLGTAANAFVAGLHAAAAGGTLRDVVLRGHAAGPGCAPFAGALHGAMHGLSGIAADDVERLELGWVADQLSRDLVRQEAERPGPGWMGAGAAADPLWLSRYPPN